MARRQKAAKRAKPKTVLRLPDLEQSKNAVLNSLAAPSSQESYDFSPGRVVPFPKVRLNSHEMYDFPFNGSH